ncbi:hypothetical protein RRG08_045009 [Elysia crispata]|uniref:Uncharacterized protein n=1 Tax=Elysia crispata TaxID=231223 RepID=A0AAE1CRZ4_9GAST|nr:hypothetical protein RRG08_045009 [Elysia crispata]
MKTNAENSVAVTNNIFRDAAVLERARARPTLGTRTNPALPDFTVPSIGRYNTTPIEIITELPRHSQALI